MDYRRAAEIYDNKRKYGGTGYLICKGLVLTAHHVVVATGEQGVLGSQYDIRFIGDYELGQKEWRLNGGRLCWDDPEHDLALLKVNGDAIAFLDPDAPLPRFGRLGGQTELAKGIGFPRVQDIRNRQNPEPLEGRVSRIAGMKEQQLRIQVTSPVPDQPQDWQGISGTALFVDDTLVGVIVETNKSFAEKALWAVPVSYLDENREFCRLVLGDPSTPLQFLNYEHGVINEHQLTDEVLAYLDALAEHAAELPFYYPEHLRIDGPSKTSFDNIHQIVQVVEDRSAFERWRAAEREQGRAEGLDIDLIVYHPSRSRPDADLYSGLTVPSSIVTWDEHAGERFHRAILLGDPGFGKTWLLRYEARRLAYESAEKLREGKVALHDLILPIFARLSDMNRSDAPLENTLVEFVSTGHSENFSHFVRAKLNTNLCVILLDAWDEVPVEVPPDGHPVAYLPHHRQRLGQRLEQFARQFPMPRLLLTSRIVGYVTPPITRVQELELLAFDRPRIDSFITVWFGKHTAIAEEFMTMLHQHPQLQGLARIPLMLVLLCRVYQEKQLEFPIRRVTLYDHCLRGLLRDWKEEKEQREIDDAYVEAVLECLEAVGYVLFAEGYEQFSQSLLRSRIVPWLRRLAPSHELYGHSAASLIARFKRDGILITAGNHRDAPLLFLHRTFHEYLAACNIATLINSEGWEASVPKIKSEKRAASVKQLIDKKAWLPNWQEIFILLAGKINDPTPLLALLINPKKDDYFRHRLALAAMSLPELPSTVRERLYATVDYITATVFSLWWGYFFDVTGIAVRHLFRPIAALAHSGQIKGIPLLELLHLCLSDNNAKIRASATAVIGGIGPAAGIQKIIKILVDLCNDSDKSVRLEAIHAVGNIVKSTATLEILKLLAQNIGDKDELVRKTARGAIRRLGSIAATPELFNHLTDLLKNPSEDIRESAIYTLANIGRSAAIPKFINSLHYKLQEDPSQKVRIAAYATKRVLLKFATQQSVTPEILTSLANALCDPDEKTRWAAVHMIEDIGNAAATPEILDNLSTLLNDPMLEVREDAANAVGNLGSVAATEAILDRIAGLLKERHLNAAHEVLRGLKSAAATPDVLNCLAELLEDPDEFVQSYVAMIVAEMKDVVENPRIFDRLRILLIEGSAEVQENVLRAIGSVKNSESIEKLVIHLSEFLEDTTEDDFLRLAVLNAIKNIGKLAATPRILVCLGVLLDHATETNEIRRAAAGALGQFMAQGVRIFAGPDGKFVSKDVEVLSN